MNSSEGIDLEYFQLFQRNRRLPDSIFYPLLLTYILMITFGVVANLLIITLVLRQRSRHQLRHLLMVNLSMSDLLLCLITMPLTFMELVSFYWPLGDNPILCKLAGSLEAVSIYCSTLTIASIAVDRYHLIVYPTRPEGPTSLVVSLSLLGAIWVGSTLLALPQFIHRALSQHQLPGGHLLGLHSILYCTEDWPPESHIKLIYSLASTLFQFFIPISVIIFAHASICARLRRRFRPARQQQGSDAGRRSSSSGGRNRTRQILSAIALTFVLCWIPLNLFNFIDDIHPGFLAEYPQAKWTLYGLCHLAGMSSACINPVLYGWLNQNLRAELFRLFPRLHNLLEGSKPASNPSAGLTTVNAPTEVIVSTGV